MTAQKWRWCRFPPRAGRPLASTAKALGNQDRVSSCHGSLASPLEPDALKGARPVLRRGGGGNATSLSDTKQY